MLDFDFIDWDDESHPRGNLQHVADNGISRGEVEDVLDDALSRQVRSYQSSRPAVIGETSTGKTVIVIYERHEDAGYITVRPVTAYEIEP
jgi:uncharacterized DUF497 family protein